MNKLRITESNETVLRKLDNLGEKHNLELIDAKDRISKEHASLRNVQGSPMELRKKAHPGFVVSFDNIDIHLERKTMTMESQNRDFHWVNHQMVENRVSGNRLSLTIPKRDVNDVCNSQFLPSMVDEQRQKLNYVILTSRILVEYFTALEPLSDACIQHIPHKYSKEMASKTNQVIALQHHMQASRPGVYLYPLHAMLICVKSMVQ